MLWTRQLLNKALCSCKEKICHTWARLEQTSQKTVDINGPILYVETINPDNHVKKNLTTLSMAPTTIKTRQAIYI